MQEMPKMAKVIEAFHDNILSVVLNMYVLAVINLWYKSSVRKCEANKYHKCTETLLKACILN